jgi:carboxypeptidase family protein/TonB-dependent receptor-like protein
MATAWYIGELSDVDRGSACQLFGQGRYQVRLHPILCLLFVCLLASFPVFGQSPNGTISGVVFDPTGAIIAGAEITAVNDATRVQYSTATNNEGIYVLANLPPGSYRIQVAKIGFKTLIKPDIVLSVQDALAISFNLPIGAASETVTVTGGASLINTENAAVSTVVDRQFADNLPMNGRTFQTLITLAPGVTTVPGAVTGGQGEFSINGQRTEANYFTVDGVASNTGTNAENAGTGGGIGGSIPSETALGTTQSLVSVDDLQEFRINTSSYSAEYGRTPGGQISFLTRSGTNDWHGSAFDYFRNAVLDANNWFNTQAGLAKTAERQNDFGGTLGGPLGIPGIYDGKGKTFFFFSYEGMRLDVPQPALTTEVPDTFLRQNAPSVVQPLLNAFPVQNGADDPKCLPPGPPATGATCQALFTAAYSAPASLDATSIRIDHTFGSKLKVFGRFSDSPSSSITRAPKDLAERVTTRFDVKALTLGVTSAISPSVSNDFRFNYTGNNNALLQLLDNFGGAQPVPINQLFPVPAPPAYQFAAFLFYGGVPEFNVSPLRADQRQINTNDAITVVRGSHLLKFGVDYRRLSTELLANQLLNAIFYTSPAGVLSNSGIAEAATQFQSEPVFSNFSAYFEDEWRATDRLHLSLGLRWDLNPPPGNAMGSLPYTLNQITNLATAQVAPKGTPLWQTDHHAFAPRFGLAYQIHQAPGHETVLRGGVGLFYDSGNTQGAGGLKDVGFFSQALYFGAIFPLTVAQNTLPAPNTSSPYNSSVVAFDPHLTLPYTLQWNVAVEQALGGDQSLTVTYVGAAGRELFSSRFFDPSAINPNFSSGNGLYLTTNGASSDYNALQVQFQRRLSHGFQALASYTWSHSIDNLSSNLTSDEPPIRGNSDFDVRHSFAAGLTYDLPGSYSNEFARGLFEHWSLDGRITARSGLPVDIIDGLTLLPNGMEEYVRPDVVPNVPVYVADPTAPGGRLVNANAFQPPAGEFGNEPRNFVRGFGVWQTDLAIQRNFPIHERLVLKFRAEAFNLFNHPSFGNIDNNLPDGPALFGRATNTLNIQLGGLDPLYQIGGPRSIQFALKLTF